jgi:hypothetical protein
MPQTVVYFYREADGVSAVLDWFVELRRTNSKAFANCLAKLRMLKMFGHELRPPAEDYLRDGIYELRAKSGRVQYRLLYFFHGRDVAIVAHGLTKEGRVPPKDIERAIERRSRYEQNPAQYRCPQGIEESLPPT